MTFGFKNLLRKFVKVSCFLRNMYGGVTCNPTIAPNYHLGFRKFS